MFPAGGVAALASAPQMVGDLPAAVEHTLLHHTLDARSAVPRREMIPLTVELVGVRLVQNRFGARRRLHRRLVVALLLCRSG